MSDIVTAVIPQWVIDLIKSISERIDGARTSYVTATFDQVINIRNDIDTLGKGLVNGITGLNNNINASRETLVNQVSRVSNEINRHTDENTSVILSTVSKNQTQIMNKLTEVEQTLSNVGEVIGDAIAGAIKTIFNSITDLEEKLVLAQNQAFDRLEQRLSQTIADQNALTVAALNNASESIDGVNATLDEIKDVLKEELRNLTDTLSKSIEEHGIRLEKAIRESAGGITNAMLADTVAEAGYTASIVAAIAAGCTEIAVAITGTSAANKALMGAKIAKELDLIDKLMGILVAIGGIAAIDSPEAIAEVLSPIFDAYYQIGKSLTDKVD